MQRPFMRLRRRRRERKPLAANSRNAGVAAIQMGKLTINSRCEPDIVRAEFSKWPKSPYRVLLCISRDRKRENA